MRKFSYFLLSATLLAAGCSSNDSHTTSAEGTANTTTENAAPVLSYSIVGTYPHDTASFTQGLEFYHGQMLEGTGQYGQSQLMQVDLKSGRALKKVGLDSSMFGEGITVLNDTLYQLTWQEKKVLVYTAKDFKKIKEFPLNTEGWGITNDGRNLIVTDGSANLYYYEPSTFKLLRTQSVAENGTPAVNLNELEYINGFIYANQWQYTDILKIDPSNGLVVAKLDLTDVVNRLKAKAPGADVLNGIAYDSTTKKIYITGKYWPELYEIQFPH